MSWGRRRTDEFERFQRDRNNPTFQTSSANVSGGTADMDLSMLPPNYQQFLDSTAATGFNFTRNDTIRPGVPTASSTFQAQPPDWRSPAPTLGLTRQNVAASQGLPDMSVRPPLVIPELNRNPINSTGMGLPLRPNSLRAQLGRCQRT